MRIVADNGSITGGKITYAGEDLLTMSKKRLTSLRRKSMSMIFQDPTSALNPVFTIRQQLTDIVRYSTDTHFSKNEIEERAVSYLKQAALPEPQRILDSYPFQLSGGMKQRVNIAMALVSANEVLIADEPGTALDVTIEDQIMKLLKKIVEEKDISVILITHALGTVKHFVDRVYVMYAGTVVEEGPTDVVFKNPQHPYTKMLLASVPKANWGRRSRGNFRTGTELHESPKGLQVCHKMPIQDVRLRRYTSDVRGGERSQSSLLSIQMMRKSGQN